MLSHGNLGADYNMCMTELPWSINVVIFLLLVAAGTTVGR